MSAKYYSVLTDKGAARLAKAVASGSKLAITTMKLGDGGGSLPEPSSSWTKLKNTVYSAPLNQLSVSASDASQLIAEMIIPEDEGGFWIREVGLFDSDGVMIAVANCPETYKPVLAEGSGRTQTIRMIVVVSSATSVELKTDPSVVLATRAFVEDAIEQARESVPPLPHLWLPLNDSLNLMTGHGAVTFSRASGATYVDAAGRLCTAAVNEPRFERNGLLIEGQRTNNFINTAAPDKWLFSTTRVKQRETGTDEYGFTFATFEYTGNGDESAPSLISSGKTRLTSVDAGGSATLSARFKGAGVRVKFRFSVVDDDNSGTTLLATAYLNTDDETITSSYDGVVVSCVREENGWLYAQATYTSAEARALHMRIEIAPLPGRELEAGDSISMTTPQAEAGRCASSFIVCEDVPATRASDVVRLPLVRNWGRPLSVLMEISTNWDALPPSVEGATRFISLAVDRTDTGNASYHYLGVNNSGQYVQFTSGRKDDGSTEVVSRADRRGTHFIAGGRITAAGELVAVCNGNQGGAQTARNNTRYLSGNILLGSYDTTGSRHLFGHVRNLRIWHHALADNQMKDFV